MLEITDYIEENYPILYKGVRLRVEYGNYGINNSISIQLIYWDETINMELPFATATVYAEGINLEHDEVIIKDYAENEGILKMLIKNNIVDKPHGTIPLGFTKGYICQLIHSSELN